MTSRQRDPGPRKASIVNALVNIITFLYHEGDYVRDETDMLWNPPEDKYVSIREDNEGHEHLQVNRTDMIKIN